MSWIDSNADHKVVFRLLQVELIEKKLPWMNYTEALDVWTESKTMLQNTQKSLEQRKKEYEDSQVPLR